MMNARTEALLKAFISKPKGSLIIEGRAGSGVESLLHTLAEELLKENYPAQLFEFKETDGKPLGIDSVRDIKSIIATKSDARSTISRIIAIHSADNLTSEAQNALLKQIEEPTEHTLLVILTANSDNLLATIRSRCQKIPLLPLSKSQSIELAKQYSASEQATQKAYLASGGWSELLTELLTSQKNDVIQTAKTFLSEKPAQRLKRYKEMQRSDVEGLLEGVQVIAEAGMKSQAQQSSKRWQTIAEEVMKLKTLLTKNVSVKLIYLRLSVMVY